MRIELIGPLPPAGKTWCFTCAAQYIGTLTESDDWQKAVQEQKDRAEENGRSVVLIPIPDPQTSGGRLNTAVTTGTSYWAPGAPTPVCWSHIQGIKPDETLYEEAAKRREQMANPPAGLIPGKAFGMPK
jgi:hypothetical protein